MQPFESHRPATLDEVLAVLRHTSSAKVLASARFQVAAAARQALVLFDQRTSLAPLPGHRTAAPGERRAPR